MQRAKAAIILRDPGASLADTIAADREAFRGMRVLFASDVAGISLETLFEKPQDDIPIAQLFCGKGLLVFSDSVEQLMRADGSAPLRYCSRTILDTNFLSHLPRICSGQDFEQREVVTRTLAFIDGNLGRTLDWTYASLENMREVVKQGNPWPYLKVAAAKFLDEAPTAFRAELGNPVMLSGHLPKAEEQWRSWIGSPDVWQTVFRRDLTYAVMLQAMLECWRGSSAGQGLSKLVDYCLDRYEILPLKELYFGWKALQGCSDESTRCSIFDESAFRTPRKESVPRISALAWDLFLFRWWETLCTEMKGDRFYVPTVTTLDGPLLETIRRWPMRAVLIHDDATMVEAIFDDELDFQNCLNQVVSQETLHRINNPDRRSRKPVVSRYTLSASIADLERQVTDLAVRSSA